MGGLVLDALDQDRDFERIRKRRDGADDRRALPAFMDVGDEAAVDLDHVERQRAQVRQRREAGAEIVERQPDALVLQAGDDRSAQGRCRANSELSVISTTSRSAGKPVSVRIRTMRCASQPSANWEGEMLTEILIDGSQSRGCQQSASG